VDQSAINWRSPVSKCLALAFALSTSLAVAQSPELLDSISPAEARQQAQRTLAAKGGPGAVAMSPMPTSPEFSWCQKHYEAAAKLKDQRVIYRVMNSHLQRAAQLLASKDAEDHYKGLAMIFACSWHASDKLKDRALATQIVDGYVMGYLDRANPLEQNWLSKTGLLTLATAVYIQAEDWERCVASYQEFLRHARKRSDDNTADACRLKLAYYLLKLNRPEEAKEYLDGIDPRGSLAGGADKLRPQLEAALKAKKP